MTFTVDESVLKNSKPQRHSIAVRIFLGIPVAFVVAALFTLVAMIFVGVLALYVFPFFLVFTLYGVWTADKNKGKRK